MVFAPTKVSGGHKQRAHLIRLNGYDFVELPGYLVQCLVNIGNNIVDMFNAH